MVSALVIMGVFNLRFIIPTCLAPPCWRVPGNTSAARNSVRYACYHQLADGAWWYGEEEKYHWIDNFHTGYNLDSVKRYREATGDNSFDQSLRQGYEYFVKTFFEA